MTRIAANASWVADTHRPATSRSSTSRGRRQHRAADLAAAAVRAYLDGAEPRDIVNPVAGGAR